ncbi:MAG: hypothetical protein F6K16_39790 [Symploca sp. SIO2B6]|nr:hypothetical protein [Symploca sp. SIO2B6]
MMAKKPNQRNTKAEILEAFDDLMKQNKALKSELSDAKKQASGASNSITNSESAITSMSNIKSEVIPVNTATNSSTNSQSVNNILRVLTQLQESFGGAVSNLSETLTQEAVSLQGIQTAVTEQEEQLVDLYELDADEINVDSLIQDYEESEKTFGEEFDIRQGEINEEVNQARKDWSKEQEDYYRLVHERNDEASKLRQREAEEYLYDLQLERKLSTDTYDQTKKQLYQELEDIQAEQEKEWNTQEEAIATREKEFEELKNKAEALSDELDAAVKKAKEEGKGIATHQAKVKADLREKEVAGLKRSYELRLDFLEDTIQDQDERIHSLSKQLDAALKQVQDLAVKAIEGTSDSNSFEAMREIALEQARNQSKSK